MPDKRQISQEIRDFFHYLLQKSIVSDVEIGYRSGDRGGGEFIPEKKSISVRGSTRNERKRLLMHEAVHALYQSDIKSRQKEYQEAWDKMTYLGRAITRIPKHWEEGEVGAPLTEKGSFSSYTRGVFDFLDKPGRASQATNKRRLGVVQENIPSGFSWSGLRNKKEMGIGSGTSEEAEAYYLTEQLLKGTELDREKELIRFLVDYRVPGDLIRGVVKALRKKD